MKILFSKFLFIYCVILAAFIVFGLGYLNLSSQYSEPSPDSNEIIILQLEHVNSNTKTKISGPVPPVPEPERELKPPGPQFEPEPQQNPPQKEQTGAKDHGGYDARLNGFEETRLGFAVKPDYFVLPRSWQNVLSQRKGRFISELEKENANEAKNSNSNSTAQPEPVTLVVQSKKILIYDSFEWWRFNESTECTRNPEFKCEFIDRPTTGAFSLSNSKAVEDLDAILIVRDFAHLGGVNLDFISTNEKNNNTTPKIPKRIYFALESPYPSNNFQMQARPSEKGRERDYLASYWRGSDIYAPYFAWQYFDNSITKKPQERNYAEGRTKAAAIVVSNCYAHNNRLGLVKELQKYIRVDIYGHCGNIDCRATNCFDHIKKNYKFYLAFENSNCRDYITEKLHQNAYENDLVPVVLGAHPSDYKAVAPADSYIHVEDFDSIEELGRFLQLVDKSDNMYNAYFAWKGTGEFYSRNFMCEVCAFLHTEHLKEVKEFESNFAPFLDSSEKAITYFNREDAYDFNTFKWHNSDERLCLNNQEWYWNK